MRRILGTPILEFLPALGLLLFTAIYLGMAYQYRPAVRAFPIGVAWIMVVMLVLDLVSRSGTRAGAALARWLNPASSGPDEARPLARQLVAVGWLAGFATLMVLAGILIAVPIYIFSALRWSSGGRSTLACAAGAAGATLFVWVLFSVVLRIALYRGLLFGGAG
jgi:hypothetical protein